MSKIFTLPLLFCSFLQGLAAIPSTLPYQGRVSEGDMLPTGTRYFKFAIVDSETPTVAYWSNDLTSTNGSEPTLGHALTVTNGLFSISLGDGPYD